MIDVEYFATPQTQHLRSILSYLLPFFLIVILWRIIFSKMGGGRGSLLYAKQSEDRS